MKKLSIIASMLTALVALTACSTNRDENPTLSVPSDGSFKFYAPGISANTIDLDNSVSMTFKADQPNYGYTAPITYKIEFATSEDGNSWSSWQTTDTSNEDPLEIIIPAKEIASAVTAGLVELGYEEIDFPLTSQVKARLRAFLAGQEETTSVLSQEILFTSSTSYVMPPVPSSRFYMVGALPGWSGAGAITALLFPEGSDVYTYTSKFTGAWDLKIWSEEDAFKENWDAAYGSEKDGDNSPTGTLINVKAQSISAPSAEFYTYTFDKHHMTYSWTKLENQEPKEFKHISLIGNFNDWSDDVDMTQVTPHNWYVEHEFTIDDVEFKFRADHDWGTNWGATWTITDTDFYVAGVSGGDNIKCAKGKYRFYMNDITNTLMAYPVTE